MGTDLQLQSRQYKSIWWLKVRRSPTFALLLSLLWIQLYFDGKSMREKLAVSSCIRLYSAEIPNPDEMREYN